MTGHPTMSKWGGAQTTPPSFSRPASPSLSSKPVPPMGTWQLAKLPFSFPLKVKDGKLAFVWNFVANLQTWLRLSALNRTPLSHQLYVVGQPFLELDRLVLKGEGGVQFWHEYTQNHVLWIPTYDVFHSPFPFIWVVFFLKKGLFSICKKVIFDGIIISKLFKLQPCHDSFYNPFWSFFFFTVIYLCKIFMYHFWSFCKW